MEMRQFKYFLRIVELGSVSRAADSLHVAQSALSRHVANLEAEFGQALLLRTGRGVAATPAGEELARYARTMLRLGDEARAALAQVGACPSGTVAVGFPLSLTRAVCMPFIERVRVQYPRLALQVFDEISAVLADRLRAGRLQVALLFEDSPLDGLRWQPVFEEELFLVVSASHDLARHRALSAAVELPELARLPLALPSPAHGVRPIVEQALRPLGLAPAVMVEANSLTVMAQVARSGIGGAVMSAASVDFEVAAGDLVMLRIGDGALKRRAVVALSPVEPSLRATALMFEAVEQLARELAGRGHWRGCTPLPR
jgi:LysR family transcriptional regulator, nitrogen assimilation regulatory protein